MKITIALIVSLCSGNVTMDQVKAKVAELEAQHPDAKVSVRVDRKCQQGGAK